jgi:hypothetical protein
MNETKRNKVDNCKNQLIVGQLDLTLRDVDVEAGPVDSCQVDNRRNMTNINTQPAYKTISRMLGCQIEKRADLSASRDEQPAERN